MPDAPKLRDAQPGVTLIDPESDGVYLTLWESVNNEWAVLVLSPDTQTYYLNESEREGQIGYIRTRWIEYRAVEP